MPDPLPYAAKDYVLETSRSIPAFRTPDGIRLQFLCAVVDEPP